jgi:hypothetical protein
MSTCAFRVAQNAGSCDPMMRGLRDAMKIAESCGPSYSRFELVATVPRGYSPMKPRRSTKGGGGTIKFRSGEQLGQDTGPCLPIHRPLKATSVYFMAT